MTSDSVTPSSTPEGPLHSPVPPQEPFDVPQLFSAGAPESAGWTRVDPALGTYWRLALLISALILLGVGTVTWVVISRSDNSDLKTMVTPVSTGIAFAFVVGLFGWFYVVIGRRVSSIGYRLNDRELEVSSGLLFQKLVSVPFARLQLVEVTVGPIERLFGIAGVQLHTASASSNAKIPGLTPTRALALRDALNKYGEQAGL